MSRRLLAALGLLAVSFPARADEETTVKRLADALERWDLPTASAATVTGTAALRA